MKICNKCNEEKSLSSFTVRKSNGKLRHACKTCLNKVSSERTIAWRQQVKVKLVEYFGSKCLDCKYEGPPFMFDFDHRDPSKKEFSISAKGCTRSFDKLLAEASKCDLVCANCHRMRTHKQRCKGCKYCN
jgi:hypothetical protein